MKRIKKVFWIRFLASFVIALTVLGAGMLLGYQYMFGKMERGASLTREEAGVTESDYFKSGVLNIALFGIDTLDGDMIGRSDGILILTVDNNEKEMRISSIQRDTYVKIEGYGHTKLNHAYAYGGAELAVKTLNQNFGLDITDYMVINFTNMEKVIDELGGIDLDVSEAYRKEANIHIGLLAEDRGITPSLIEESGYQTLNGMQALGVLRARKNVGGTAQRSAMHEIVMKACYEKVKKMNALQYPGLIRSLLGLVKTTLNAGDLTGLATKVVLSGYPIRQGVFPLEADQPNGDGGAMIDGVWYLTYDEEEGGEHLRDFIYNGVLYGEDDEDDEDE